MTAKLEAGKKPNTKGKHISTELEDASGDELEATDEVVIVRDVEEYGSFESTAHGIEVETEEVRSGSIMFDE